MLEKLNLLNFKKCSQNMNNWTCLFPDKVLFFVWRFGRVRKENGKGVYCKHVRLRIQYFCDLSCKYWRMAGMIVFKLAQDCVWIMWKIFVLFFHFFCFRFSNLAYFHLPLDVATFIYWLCITLILDVDCVYFDMLECIRKVHLDPKI